MMGWSTACSNAPRDAGLHLRGCSMCTHHSGWVGLIEVQPSRERIFSRTFQCLHQAALTLTGSLCTHMHVSVCWLLASLRFHEECSPAR